LRRVLAWSAFALALLAALAAAAWLGVREEGPELLRRQLASRLSEALGTDVSIERVSFRFDRSGLELVAPDLRAFPSEAGPALAAERVEIHVDLWMLLLGRLRVRELDLAAPTLHLRRLGERLGVDAPGAPALGVPSRAGDEGEGVEPWYETLGHALPHLGLRDGRVQIRDALGAGRDLEVEALSASLTRRWLRGGLRVDAEGSLRGDGEAAGRFEVEGQVSGASSLSARVEGLDLYAVAALVGGSLAELAPRGHASGRLSVDFAGPAASGLEADLRAPRLRLEPRVAGRPQPVDVARAHLALRGSRTEEAGLTLRGQAGLGNLALPFEVSLGADRRDIRFGPVDLAALGPLAAALPEPQRSQLVDLLRDVHGGRLEELTLHAEPAEPGGAPRLRADWSVAGVDVGVGRESRLQELAAVGRYDGDALELRASRARLDGEALPALDLRIAGLANVRGFSELRCLRPGPGSSLPGRVPLARWIEGGSTPGAPPSWRRLRVEADFIQHPALLCAVERVAAEVRPQPGGGGLDVSLEHAVWAGVPLRGSAHYESGGDETATLRLEVGPPFEPTQPQLHRRAWARGHFDFETSSLGRWHTQWLSGSFQAAGTHLILDDSLLQLDPGPPVDAFADVDLGATDRVPFEAHAQIRGGTLPDLYAAGGWEEHVTGSVVGAVRLTGALRAGQPTLGNARGGFSLHARDGLIRQRFRLLLAVGMASETLNPFREQGTIRYGAMDAEGRVGDGDFLVDTFAIDGPALRAAASGRIGTTDDHATELVMGLFFFRTLDDVIGRLPVLNRVLLGKEGNLVGAYVALTGPWEGLETKIIPMKTLLKGPVGFVFEGLPSFVVGGLRRVQDLLPSEAGGTSEDS
jgi:AsmA-like C-terminal region